MSEKDKFFANIDKLGLALTYDDVRLRTMYSDVLPKEVDTSSKFSRNISLKIPIASAAMDTVTEHTLAIELAKLGGIGIIHKNLTPKQQSHEVGRVKYHLNGLIKKPIFVKENITIEELLNMKKEKDYGFSTFPIVDDFGFLKGIVSQTDLDFCDDHSLNICKIMTKPSLTADKKVKIDEAYDLMKSKKKKVLPLVDKSGKLSGMYVFSDLKRILNRNPQDHNLDDNGQLIVGAAISVFDYERLDQLISNKVDVVVIDTAHGDSKGVIETIKYIKSKYSIDVLAGNISEPWSAENLLKAGADGIKIGQGPGSICTTRVIAGVGCPQVTAVYECAKVAEKYDAPVCADGGIKHSGDIPIAIGAGAQSVMLGNLLAGTLESPGDVVFKDGRQWKNYRGMGSLGAMKDNEGSKERYGQKGVEKDKLVPEGIEGLTPYKGELSDVITQYVGGLQAGMGYTGSRTIKELRDKAQFRIISSAGKSESHPHDVMITKEAPNYTK